MTITINVVTILFATADMSLLIGPGQSECSMALMNAFEGTTPPYVQACNILTARVAAVDIAAVQTTDSSSNLDVAITAACGAEGTEVDAVLAANALLMVHKWMVGKVIYLLHALGLGHTVVRDGVFEGFDEKMMGEIRFDRDESVRNLGSKSKAIEAELKKNFLATSFQHKETYTIASAVCTQPIPAPVAVMPTRVPGSMTRIPTSAADVEVTTVMDGPRCLVESI